MQDRPKPLFLIPALIVPAAAAIFAGYGLYEFEGRLTHSEHSLITYGGLAIGVVLFWLFLPKAPLIPRIVISLFYCALMALVGFIFGGAFII